MTSIPELKVEGLHPDHVGPLQAALAQARELLAAVESGEDRRPTKEATGAEPKARGASGAGNRSPEGQRAGSPWETDQVVSWVSPHHQKNKESE